MAMADIILKKLDELIDKLSEEFGINEWSIHLRNDLAKTLFGFPVPETYKDYPIIINEDIQEITLGNRWSSDIWVVPVDEI